MQPSLKSIGNDSGSSFKVEVVKQSFFYPYWHFHPEYEIMYVKKGKGIRYVGDDIQLFGPGDIILLGNQIPHLWRNDASYFGENNRYSSEAIVVYFDPEKWGKSFRELSEMKQLEMFFVKAKRGIRFTGNTRQVLVKMLNNLINTNGMSQLLVVMSLLDTMSKTNDFEFLASCSFSHVYQSDDMEIINRITDYMMKNYAEKISIDTLADLAHLSLTAFCRYFKARTNKTAGRFLNEIRIGHACNKLIYTKLPVNEICFEVGFNNMTNFNIQFKNIKKITPSDYRKLHSLND